MWQFRRGARAPLRFIAVGSVTRVNNKIAFVRAMSSQSIAGLIPGPAGER